MKITVGYEVSLIIQTELEINEDQIIKDFGSVENFDLWNRFRPNDLDSDTNLSSRDFSGGRKEYNLYRVIKDKLDEDFHKDGAINGINQPYEYLRKFGIKTKSEEGHRWDRVDSINLGSLENNRYPYLLTDEPISVDFENIGIIEKT
tara:strand:- start:1171 stop:1611 length:441 start_codon:yes stop_codon:yes gene_type:complete